MEARQAVAEITHKFSEETLPPPPNVKIHDPHYDFHRGDIHHIDYFPFCENTYFNWLLCHGSYIYRTTVQELEAITQYNKV